ncbi:MAG: sigma-54 dependent transcriptional regulator [Deltaproteobacteria bacterium]|jgi:two-component system response regulator HydG|nr:sigma-54 dependent transcriptional regulator [Deltaproteobacteria bacterium]
MAAEDPILVVDDDPENLAMLKEVIGDWCHAVETATSGAKALDKTKDKHYSLILMDVRMETEKDGLETLYALRAGDSPSRRTPVVIMTAYAGVQDAVDALKGGAADYLVKPVDLDVLRHAMDNILKKPVVDEVKAPAPAASSEGGSRLIGDSPAFRKMLETALLAAGSEATVLITGESGTGKEEVAKLIQRNSLRAGEKFVSINCAALADNLLESELFGHVKGAFTGAETTRNGRLMAAHGGTVFLDEIGDVSSAFQVKLLRTLQEGEIQRLGSDEVHKVDVRFIAATNKNLEKAIQDSQFREDLYYRLNVLTVHVPPLRERAGDLPLLAEHFVKAYAAKNKKQVKGLEAGALEALKEHVWPGNIRELQNAMERAVIISSGELVTEKDLTIRMGPGRSVPQTVVMTGSEPTGGALEDYERQAVAKAYNHHGGNKTKAAEELGVTRKTLAAKIKKFGLDSQRTRNGA